VGSRRVEQRISAQNPNTVYEAPQYGAKYVSKSGGKHVNCF